ncbi:MAG: TMEM43 family protein [Treponema sp.]|nr:TMEM43 family protein [Treponema sp.]
MANITKPKINLGGNRQKIQSQGFFSNLKNSVVGLFIGIAVVFGACWLLFWNEVRANAADAAKSATELTESNVSSLQNRPVWTKGALTGTGVELDQFLNRNTDKKYIYLSRSIERYVWVENEKKTTKDKAGGGTETITTYEYNLRWSSSTPNSSNFKDPDARNSKQNPAVKPDYTGFTRTASDLKIGGFNLADGVSLSDARSSFKPNANNIANGMFFNGNYIYENEKTASAPSLGDYRISYRHIENNTNGIVLGKLSGNGDYIIRLDFKSSGVVKTSSSIYRFFNVSTIEEVTSILQSEHKTGKVVGRVFGIILSIIGFMLLFGPIQAIAGIIPILKKITGKIIMVIAVILGLVLSIVVIIVANIINSVIALIVLLALVAAFIAYGVYKGKKNAETEPAV